MSKVWMLLFLSESSVIWLSVYMVAILSSVCMFSVHSKAFNIASLYVCMYVCMYFFIYTFYLHSMLHYNVVILHASYFFYVVYISLVLCHSVYLIYFICPYSLFNTILSVKGLKYL
jgi:hypothetical protein